MLKRVYLEITNVCNLACSFCPGTRREKRFLSEEEFSALIGKLQGQTQYLYFHLMGEPLLHPSLGRFLSIAGEMGFRVILTTNGTLLARKEEILLDAPALYKVNLSLQSFEANEGGELSDYVNLCAAFAAKAAAAGKICELRLWNRGGRESLNTEILRLLEKQFPAPWERSPRSVKLADRVFLAEDDKFDWPELDAPDRGERCFCYGLRDQVGVLVDGTVVPCCLDHDGELPLGNLFEQELSEIMSTEKARQIYHGFSQKRAVEPLCRRCGYARRFT
ncbi:MAG: SPASM domain-containing protein [Oscillospiraceae bacterium]|nr:SPASM domain-containing protein [Oscillospiraceae bacterium]